MRWSKSDNDEAKSELWRWRGKEWVTTVMREKGGDESERETEIDWEWGREAESDWEWESKLRFGMTTREKGRDESLESEGEANSLESEARISFQG